MRFVVMTGSFLPTILVIVCIGVVLFRWWRAARHRLPTIDGPAVRERQSVPWQCDEQPSAPTLVVVIPAPEAPRTAELSLVPAFPPLLLPIPSRAPSMPQGHALRLAERAIARADRRRRTRGDLRLVRRSRNRPRLLRERYASEVPTEDLVPLAPPAWEQER
ncbi:hypothetical protein HYV74_04395 [Candidatus Uhrbacteria bacterium]|nr:hypothetical protein [Candidatus Uhrbacteria bacterium]